MARVTVEDALPHVDNRFALVLLASKRARQLMAGARPLVEHSKNKPCVLAIREIATGHVGLDDDPALDVLAVDRVRALVEPHLGHLSEWDTGSRRRVDERRGARVGVDRRAVVRPLERRRRAAGVLPGSFEIGRQTR